MKKFITAAGVLLLGTVSAHTEAQVINALEREVAQAEQDV